MGKLNKKQEKFCHEYIIDHNATQAAIRAGYKAKNAASTGCENLTKPNIKEYIAELEKTVYEKLGITKERILQEQARIGFSRMDNHVDIDDQGCVSAKTFEQMGEDALACIKKVKHKRVLRETPAGDVVLDNTFEFELYDKQKALDTMGKDLGLGKEQIEITGKLDFNGIEVKLVKPGEAES